MWRGQDDGLHAGMPDGLLVAAVVLEAVRRGELLTRRIGLRITDDLDVVPCLLQHGGHLPAPPAEADHRDSNRTGLAHLDAQPIPVTMPPSTRRAAPVEELARSPQA